MKLFIAVPSYGEIVHVPTLRSLFGLSADLSRRGWTSQLATLSYADIAESRNYLLTRWFDQTDASHLLFVDADMGFDPQLVFEMVEFDQPLTGAVYPRRQIDLARLGDAITAGASLQAATAGAHDYVVQDPWPRHTARNGFLQVKGCGTGVLLIKRACIETMIQRIPEIVDASPAPDASRILSGRVIRAFAFLTVNGVRLSEDFSFCHRWREGCGGEVWANIAHVISHAGIRNFASRYADAPGARVRVRTIAVPGINAQAGRPASSE